MPSGVIAISRGLSPWGSERAEELREAVAVAILSTCWPLPSVTYSSLPSALSAIPSGWLLAGRAIGAPTTESVVGSITTTAGPEAELVRT